MNPTYSFRLPDAVSGKIISLADFSHQKAIVVIFTCNHCPYAIAYEQRLINLAKKWSPKGIAFLAISANDSTRYPQDGLDQMKVRAEQKGFPFPYLYDESQEVARAFGAQRTPEVFLLQPNLDSEIVYWGAIDDHYPDEKGVNESYLDNAITALLNGHRPNPAQTQAVGCSIKWKTA